MGIDDIYNKPAGAGNEEEDELDNIVTLYDEDGNELEFEVLDLIELEDENYVVLLPTDYDEAADGEVAILRLESVSEDEEAFVSIEDEEILNKVFEIFKENNKDEFDFVDDD